MSARRWIAWVLLLTWCSVAVVSAQQTDATCPAVVQQALAQVGANCNDLGRNSACYGNIVVNASFNETFAPISFARPADRAELVNIRSISTAPLDLALQQWGIAILNVQANVPGVLAGQAVTFVLMGDAEIENAAIDSSPAQQPVTIITQAPVNTRSGPQLTSAVTGTIPAGTVIEIDALSEDQQSLRVRISGTFAWIDRAAVNPSPTIDQLPVVEDNAQSPMQSFYIRTGVGRIECAQAPNVLALQSPAGMQIDLTANGANIRMGSLITIETLPDNRMVITTLEGEAILEPDMPEAVRLPAGFSSERCLLDAEDLGTDGNSNDQVVGPDCPWSEPQLLTPEQIDTGTTVLAAFGALQLSQQPQPTAAVLCPAGTTLTHTVAEGENLFRISQRYGTSMGAIMQASGISDPNRILVGQVLTILCGVDTGLPSVPPITPVPGAPASITPLPPGSADCSRFRATSPLDGFAYGRNTFYWDAAPGATSYRVNVYSVDEKPGALVGSFETAAPNTNLTTDLTVNSIGYGFSFSWEVLALVNGQVACASPRVTVPREAPAQPQPATFNAGATCTGLYQFGIDYNSLPAGTTSVTVSYTFVTGGAVTPPSPVTAAVPPDPGIITLSGFGPATITGISVTANPSGVTVSVPGTLSC